MMAMRIYDLLFGFSLGTMIFFNLPFEFPVRTLGLGYNRSPVCYALWLLVFYTVYKHRDKRFFVHSDVFCRWLLCYLGISLLSTVWGVYTFPYEELFFSPPGQHPAAGYILRIADAAGFSLDPDSAVIFGVWLRAVKGAVTSPFFTFCASYLLYCYYYRDFASLKKVALYGFFVSLAIVIGYSVIEIFYQAGNETAKNILTQTYPWFNNMKTVPLKWPPLLWPNQLRSIFSEPSRIGNYAAIAIPVLWGGIIQAASVRSKVGFAFLTFFFTFIIFLTQSRMAYAILLGLLFLCWALALWLKRFRRSVALIGALTAVSFICAGFFMFSFMKQTNIASKMISNTFSVAIDGAKVLKEDANKVVKEDANNNDKKENNKKDKVRSKARYIMLASYYRMWLERPVLGVGDFQPFAAAYSMHNLTDEEKKDPEIKSWVAIQHNYGILQGSGLSAMNQYADRLGKTGLLGLGFYLMPFLYVLYRLLSVIYYAKNHLAPISDSALGDAFIMFLMICGILATGMNDNHAMYFGPFAVLGAAYVFLSEHNIWRTGLYKPGNEV